MNKNNNTYVINIPIEVRYIAKNKESGIIDLAFIVTSPSHVDSSSIYMTEIQPGIYRAYFTPDEIGYWWVRVYSIAKPENTYTDDFFVDTDYTPSGVLNHNDLSNIQGGIITERFHLTQADYIGIGTGPLVRQTYVNDIVYGTNLFQAESLNITTTTSTSYIQKLRLLTTSIPLGLYRIGYSYQIAGTNSISVSVLVRVQVDDGVALSEDYFEPGDLTDYLQHSGFGYVNLSLGIHFIDLDFAIEISPQTAAIKNARLELWRAS